MRCGPGPGSWPPSRPRPATPPAGASCSTRRRPGARPRSPGPAWHPARTSCSGPGPARRAAPAHCTALAAGCGPGGDAEFAASPGFNVVAFDIAPAAIDGARGRLPGSCADYAPGDLLNPPSSWHGAFGLVVEICTAQPLHGTDRATAVSTLPRLAAPGRDPSGFPRPLTRAEIGSAAGLLRPVEIELLRDGRTPPAPRWRAEFNRTA